MPARATARMDREDSKLSRSLSQWTSSGCACLHEMSGTARSPGGKQTPGCRGWKREDVGGIVQEGLFPSRMMMALVQHCECA